MCWRAFGPPVCIWQVCGRAFCLDPFLREQAEDLFLLRAAGPQQERRCPDTAGGWARPGRQEAPRGCGSCHRKRRRRVRDPVFCLEKIEKMRLFFTAFFILKKCDTAGKFGKIHKRKMPTKHNQKRAEISQQQREGKTEPTQHRREREAVRRMQPRAGEKIERLRIAFYFSSAPLVPAAWYSTTIDAFFISASVQPALWSASRIFPPSLG